MLEEARRAIAARDDLLAVVSHDLRNPLGAISLSASQIDRLAGDPRATHTIRSSVRLIQSAVEQMNRLIADLIDLAKLEKGQLLALTPTVCDAGELVRAAAEQLAPLAAARHLTLTATPEEDAGRLFCDGQRLLQVFSNLIGNAIRYTREGGSIFIHAERRGAEICFSVSDTGVGIPEDKLPNVFEPYWQADPGRRSGLGLGHSIAKAIVEAHGGSISMSSAVGKGTEVIFSLPALDTERPADPPAKERT